MKTEKTTPVQKLEIEANHYLALAQSLALKNLFRPDPANERLAREHALRAETYKAAAKLIA